MIVQYTSGTHRHSYLVIRTIFCAQLCGLRLTSTPLSGLTVHSCVSVTQRCNCSLSASGVWGSGSGSISLTIYTLSPPVLSGLENEQNGGYVLFHFPPPSPHPFLVRMDPYYLAYQGYSGLGCIQKFLCDFCCEKNRQSLRKFPRKNVVNM